MSKPGIEKHVFFLLPRARRQLLRFLGAIDLAGGALIVLAGLGFVFTDFSGARGAPPFGYGIVFLIGGISYLYVGRLMATNDVVVTSTTIRSAGPPRRSVKREDVVSIDIVRKDFGNLKRVVPMLILRNGATVPLTPLAWSPSPWRPTANLTLARQHGIIAEIRELLNVEGVDYAES